MTSPYRRPKPPENGPGQRTAASRELEALHRDAGCQLCPLHSNCGPQLVCMWGNGPVPAEGMVIGESPADADYQAGGVAMAEGGGAAEYLATVLGGEGVSMSSLYRTYVIKCRQSLGTREAERHQKLARNACGRYVDAEAAAVKPQAVLALGGSALFHLTHKVGIMKQRGQAYFDPKWQTWVVPTISPGYVMQFPQYHEAFTSDVARFVRLMRGESDQPQVDVRTVLDMDAWRSLRAELLAAPGIVTYDLETRGFVDYRPGFSCVWCTAFSTGARNAEGNIVSWLVPLEHPDSPFIAEPSDMRELMLGVAEVVGASKANGHNVKFDNRSLEFSRRRYASIGDEELAEWCESLRSRSLWEEDEPRRMERRLTRTERLEALERLAVELALRPR